MKRIDSASEEEITTLEKFIKDFLECEKCIEKYNMSQLLDCPTNRQKAEELINDSPKEAWREPRLRFCVARKIMEKIKERREKASSKKSSDKKEERKF